MKRANSTDFGFDGATPYSHFKPTPISGGDSNKPDHARRAAREFPRPSTEDATAPAPLGLNMPPVNKKSGGSSNKPMPCHEGTGISYTTKPKFTPEDKSEMKPLSPIGMGPAQPMSGARAASKNPDGKPKRWTERGYERGNPRLEGEE